jgi:hypothetical protein
MKFFQSTLRTFFKTHILSSQRLLGGFKEYLPKIQLMNLNYLIIAVFISTDIFGQTIVPYGVRPLSTDIRLLYRPGFESKCSSIPEGQGDNVETSASLALDSVGQLNYRLRVDNITAIFDINEDGFPSFGKSPVFETNDSTVMDPKIIELIEKLVASVPPGFGVVGKTLRQGGELAAIDICKSLPGATSNVNSLKRKVVGTVGINDRSSLIISTNGTVSCNVQGEKIELGVNGWESFDLQSGLLGSSVAKMTVKLPNETRNWIMKSDCNISKTSINSKATDPTGKTAEQRLLEIKSLMDKGLITKEQYDMKREDIIKLL